MATELFLFQTGAVGLPRGSFHPWIPEADRSAMALAPVWSALVRTSEGNVLFDTGLHPVHVTRPDATFGPRPDLRIVMRDEDAVVRRLAEVNVRPDDVAVVVNSHLHFDHAGNNGAFPRATFVVQAEHLAHAKGRANFPGVYWDIPELMYVPADGRTRIARGVEVVPTPGHAPGHQSLIVDLPETGRVVLCGDAAYTRDNLERLETPAQDQEAARGSLRSIRALVRDDLDRCFPSHDAVAWAAWRHAPEGYR